MHRFMRRRESLLKKRRWRRRWSGVSVWNTKRRANVSISSSPHLEFFSGPPNSTRPTDRDRGPITYFILCTTTTCDGVMVHHSAFIVKLLLLLLLLLLLKRTAAAAAAPCNTTSSCSFAIRWPYSIALFLWPFAAALFITDRRPLLTNGPSSFILPTVTISNSWRKWSTWLLLLHRAGNHSWLNPIFNRLVIIRLNATLNYSILFKGGSRKFLSYFGDKMALNVLWIY